MHWMISRALVAEKSVESAGSAQEVTCCGHSDACRKSSSRSSIPPSAEPANAWQTERHFCRQLPVQPVKMSRTWLDGCCEALVPRKTHFELIKQFGTILIRHKTVCSVKKWCCATALPKYQIKLLQDRRQRTIPRDVQLGNS